MRKAVLLIFWISLLLNLSSTYSQVVEETPTGRYSTTGHSSLSPPPPPIIPPSPPPYLNDEDGLSTASVLFSILSISAGIILLLAGYRLFFFYLICVGFVVAGGLTLMLMTAFTKSDSLSQLVLCCVIGVVAGIICLVVHWIGIFVGGALISLFIIACIGIIIGDNIIIILISIVVPIIVGVFSVFRIFQKPSILIASSLLGSYGIIACIDFFTHSSAEILYVLPRYMKLMRDNDEWPNFYTWLLLCLCLILASIGFVVQFAFTGKKYEHAPLFDLLGYGFNDYDDDSDYEDSDEEEDFDYRKRGVYQKYGREPYRMKSKKPNKKTRLFGK